MSCDCAVFRTMIGYKLGSCKWIPMSPKHAQANFKTSCNLGFGPNNWGYHQNDVSQPDMMRARPQIFCLLLQMLCFSYFQETWWIGNILTMLCGCKRVKPGAWEHPDTEVWQWLSLGLNWSMKWLGKFFQRQFWFEDPAIPFWLSHQTLRWDGYYNKWRGVTISLRTGGQGHPTPIHTPNPTPYTNIHKKYPKRSFFHFSTRSPLWTNGPTDGRMDKASYRDAWTYLKTIFDRPPEKPHFFAKQYEPWTFW